MKPLFSLSMAAVMVASIAAQIEADDWPLVRGNLAGTGVAESKLSDKLDVIWSYKTTGDAGFEATAVMAAGIIYVGDNAGTFHAVNFADGSLVWTKAFENTSFLAGAAIDGGKLYVGDGNGIVRCLAAADGTEIWNADLGAEIYAGPTVHEQRVLVTSESGTFVCFDAASGDERWTFRIEAPLRCSPTVISGHVLLAGCDSQLHVIDAATGEETNKVTIDAPTGSTAAAQRERVFLGTEGGTFYAIDAPAGVDKPPGVAWSFRDAERGQPIRSAAAVNELLVVYGSQSKAIFALDPANGELKWKLATRSRVDTSPVIAGDRVVAAAERGVVYVLDAAIGDVKWQFDAGGRFTASPIVVESRIIVGNTDGTLNCFGAMPHGNELNHGDTEDTKKK